MQNKLINNMKFYKRIFMVIIGTIFCITFFCITFYIRENNAQKKVIEKNLLADGSGDISKIDITTLKFNAKLKRLTNIQKINNLKKELIGKTEKEIYEEAIKRGMVVEQENGNDKNLEIGVNLDFSGVNITQLGNYNTSDSVSLKDINLNNPSLYTKSLKDLNITGGEVKTEYEITLKENPITDDSSDLPKDVAILVDGRMDGNTASQMLNGLNNCIFNTSTFTEGSGKLNFKEIPFHTKLKDKDYYALCNHNNVKDDLQQMAGFISSDFKAENIENSSDELNCALKKAKTFFKELDLDRAAKGESSAAGKTIILLSRNIDETEYNKCEIKDSYNVVTICVSAMEYGKSTSDLAQDYNSYLKKFHNAIGGMDSTYYVSNNTQNGGDGTHNDIQSSYMSVDGENIMQKVAKDLSWLKYNKFINTEATLNFNPGEDITSFSENVTRLENGRFKINMPGLKLKTDYVILSEDYNFVAGEDFINDLIYEMVHNIKKSNNDRREIIKEYLKNRLKDLKIEITDDQVTEIIGDMYSVKLIKTIDDINKEYNNKIFNNGNSIFSISEYEAIKNKTIADMLNDNNENYAKLKEILIGIVKVGFIERLNHALSYEIASQYDISEEIKNKIIDGILNNVDITSIIKKLTGKTDSEIANLVSTIKETLLEKTVDKLKLSDTSKKELNSLSNMKCKDALAASSGISENTKQEIRGVLRQSLNKYLQLTKTNYIIESNDGSSNFIIEPTGIAALSELKTRLQFIENKFDIDKSITDGGKNNYIQYSSKNQSTEAKNEELINSIPILNIKRILISKTHGVYGKLEETKMDDDRIIIAAKAAEHDEKVNFARNSMITFAANITNLNEVKNIELSIDSKFKPINEEMINDKAISCGQKPRIYVVENNKLKLICEMNKEMEGKYVASDFPGNQYKDIIILYSVLVNEDGTYNNSVKVSGLSKGDGDSKITAAQKMPELF